ncbi:hypothetical protein Rmag_0892 [Candidatus Ruthia magnifica str. Cm (Calyptogena magnifica)]|uniref:LicD/FKTN/FKRP nucleotidyltransferase domain-containing protein n=1 Tax=Ruthia magnifica subsp. Calyptogena magnifica TaxID=413404 RepID=A1AXE9_RUTMC|nr:LicD family protein [Candidatus Ruthturnera calyptogenae]ABL02606.1 hypothetical protein Rmag_0892 [Candidatus Ruthia magnifica str. Cm (Calyptogena magnifica)]
MINEISTNRGTYKYTPIELFYGRKIIDLDVCKNNLLNFKTILDRNNVSFGLTYGTLLGAIREKNFIKYDEDVDVFCLDENRETLLSLLFELKNNGFVVARYERDLLSIIRDDDYIDIYFFKKKILGRRVCNSDSINSFYLEKFDTINFLDTKFNVPKNPMYFLEKIYGLDWNIPKKNQPAVAVNLKFKVKKAIKSVLPNFLINYFKKILRIF